MLRAAPMVGKELCRTKLRGQQQLIHFLATPEYLTTQRVSVGKCRASFQPHQQQAVARKFSCRCFHLKSRHFSSSNGGSETPQGGDGSNIEKNKRIEQNRAPESSNEEKIEKDTSSSESAFASLKSSASTTKVAEQLNEGIKRVQRAVTDINVGDQLSIIFIGLLTTLILLAPYMAQQLHKGDDLDEFFSTDDAIDDFTKLVRNDWGIEVKHDGKGHDKSPVDVMLKDVLRSKSLQQAAQEFVVRMLDSAEVKVALNRLVKHLWDNLVQDPETLAQIIKLLQIAIQNPSVQNAARDLVLDLVEDPEVKAALIRLVQELGLESQVQQATQDLITKSAHNSLNDAEILEHSMEFATDVLGDDIVQRTAGEALRNTVGHAFRPATSILLTAAGVGLVIFGAVAIGYARLSEQEVVLFDSAARSLQTKTAHGMIRIITWPVRLVGGLLGKIIYVLQESIQATWQTVTIISGMFISLPVHGVLSIWRGLTVTLISIARGVSYGLLAIKSHLVESMCLIWQTTVAALFNTLGSMWSKTRFASIYIGQEGSSAVTRSVEHLWDALIRLATSLQAMLHQSVHCTHKTANNILNKLGLAIEHYLQVLLGSR